MSPCLGKSLIRSKSHEFVITGVSTTGSPCAGFLAQTNGIKLFGFYFPPSLINSWGRSQCHIGQNVPIALPCPLAARVTRWDAAQFGMEKAQAGKAGFNSKRDVMNNQQEEQEPVEAEAGGKFLSQKPAQASSFFKEKSPVWLFPPSLGLE